MKNQPGATSKEQTIKYSDSIDSTRKEQKEKKSLGTCAKVALTIGLFIGIIIIVVIVYLVLNKDKCKGEDQQCNNINPGGGKNEKGEEGNQESDTSGDEKDPKNGNESKDENDPKTGNESKDENDPKTGNEPKDDAEENDDDLPNEEELKEIFSPLFKINSEVGTLRQTLMESKQNLKVKSENSIDYTYIRAKIDTYVISEDSPESSKISNYFQKKITTSISINSLCYTSQGTECEYIKYLDLSESNKNNLRQVEQEPNIEDLTIPLCLIEHTDSNIILSINCPNNLEENLKYLIETAFKCIKPETIKGAEEEDKTLSDTTIETKDEKIEINSFSKLCEDEEEEDRKCESYKKIITDKDGNFISCNQKIKTETYYITNEYDYNLKDITSENSASLNSDNFRTNLNTLLNFLKNYMNKETYYNMRRLKEESGKEGFQNNVYFNKTIGNFNINASISDNIILNDISLTDSNIILNNKTEIISHNEINSNLTKTIENFQVIMNAVNTLITILSNETSKPLEEIINNVITEFTKINNNLVFKDLSSIFDSTFLISELQEFPYTIVSASKNLFSNIKNLNDDLLYSINEYKTKLKDDISTFLSNGHNLIYKLFNNLKELNTLLSSKKSKIASISAFYGLNKTNSSYIKAIEEANEILGNYYINEKNKVEYLLNELFGKFSKESLQSIENGQYILDNVTNRLEDKSVHINRGDEDDIRTVIDNIYNAKIIENQIIPKVVENMKKNIILNNGYLVTQNVIEENKKTYSPISESALNIANNLVKNTYIDEIFDEIMRYFRQQFTKILENIETSKSENFPLKLNVLSSEFNTSFIDLETSFKSEKTNIKNIIEKDNKNFFNSINKEINSFLETNKNNLTNLINNIENNLSKTNLNNIDYKYYEMLNYSMGNVTQILDNNYRLASTYLNDVGATTHFTLKIKNTITIYFNKLNEIQTYIERQIKIDLANKYKNIINQIKKELQSIKSNSIINKYYKYKDLSFLKTHIDIYINQIFSTLNDFISDEKFNTKYLTTINNFVISTINKINTQRENLNKLYNPISKKAYTSDGANDIYYEYKYRCCKKRFLGICIKKRDCYDYKPKSVASSDNYKKILNVVFNNYSKDLDTQFNQIFNTFSKNIHSYNNIVAILGNKFETIINNFSQKKLDFMNSISEKSKSFINNQLGIKVLQLSYNYYKNELNKKLPTELNAILEQWKALFNKVYKDIEDNINEFKYPIEEFNTLAIIYYEYYRQNISYSYTDTMVEQRKSDFNYTIKYYYNLFLSKVNQTYTYILSNIPSNEKPFDNILSNYIDKINNSYNEIMNLTLESQKEILNLKKQLNTFKVSETNFFEVNSHSVDLSYKIEEEVYPLIEKFDEVSNMALNKYNSEESIACRFYLENSEDGREIEELYNNIYKETFFDFKFEEYQALFQEILNIDADDIKKKILDFLTASNEEIKSIFETKKKDYKAQLQNEIFNKLYTKASLEEKIEKLYSEGLNNLDASSTNLILKYIDEIIEKIGEHLDKENRRLTNELTTYSNNFNVFTQRLNGYKNKIYNKFYTIIHSVINDFYINIKQKFYTNYIVEHLEILYNNTKREAFSKTYFLNISINLKEVMDEEIEILTSEYKNWTLNHINYLNEQKLQHLNDLFSFDNLKIDIYNKIENLYSTNLSHTLIEKATYNSGDEGVSDYDFSEDIINNIDSFIDEKINKAKEQIEKMKGSKFEIDENWKIPDFSYVRRDIFSPIQNDFDNNFSKSYLVKEEKDFYNVMSVILTSNFKQIIDNFVPSFGKDYFKRILKYNEIQKVKSLYENLKYSIGITLTYYLFLTYSSAMTILPEDLEIKIMTLNNIDSVIKKKNNDMLSSLNSKFEEFLASTKNNLVEIYFNHIKEDFTLKNEFNKNITELIASIFENKRNIFEDEYINMMNSYIKFPFIEQYSKTIKESTDDIINFIAENKESLRLELKELLVMNKDETLKNIDTKKDETFNSIEEYKEFFGSFKISKDIQDFLDNYASKNILSYHKEIQSLLDDKTKNLLLGSLSKNSDNFKAAYFSENIESKFNETINFFNNSFFGIINKSLKKYGTIDDVYLLNLEHEIINNINNKTYRRLEEIQNGPSNLKVETTLKSLKSSSQSAKQQIQTLDLFSNFDEKINKYINIINEEYEITKISITKRKYTEEITIELNKILDELKEISILYYDKYKENYNKTKEYIEDSILKIDKLIEKSSNITNNAINDKFQEIKKNYHTINDNNEKNLANQINLVESNGKYKVHIKIDEIIKKNKFYFEIINENGIYKLKGQSINGNRPKSFSIDYSSKVGICVEKGKELTIRLDNISSIVDLEFDSSLLVASIIKRYNFSEYYISYTFYNETQTQSQTSLGGINVSKKSSCIRKLITELSEGEKDNEKISSKSGTVEDSIIF